MIFYFQPSLFVSWTLAAHLVISPYLAIFKTPMRLPKVPKVTSKQPIKRLTDVEASDDEDIYVDKMHSINCIASIYSGTYQSIIK